MIVCLCRHRNRWPRLWGLHKHNRTTQWMNVDRQTSTKRTYTTALFVKRLTAYTEYRKRGIAYNLIVQLEKSVMERNFRYSYIVTGKNNHAAIGLYEKLNYELIDNFGQFRDDDKVVCMRKEFESLRIKQI